MLGGDIPCRYENEVRVLREDSKSVDRISQSRVYRSLPVVSNLRPVDRGDGILVEGGHNTSDTAPCKKQELTQQEGQRIFLVWRAQEATQV